MPRGPQRPTLEALCGLPGDTFASGTARRFVRTAIEEWTLLDAAFAAVASERLADDAVLLTSELVTNAVVHAGTSIELRCRIEVSGGFHELLIEVSDLHPARVLRTDERSFSDVVAGGGRGLRLLAELAGSWGVTYRRTAKTVWFRLSLPYDSEPAGQDSEPVIQIAPARRPSVAVNGRAGAHWSGQGALSFLAEASDVLAGQFDEDMVASLAVQLLVPRFADWSALWLEGGGGSHADSFSPPRLARVWHASEERIEPLRQMLEKEPPELPSAVRPGAIPWKWPGDPAAYAAGGAALACGLVAGGRRLGTLVLGRAGLAAFPDEFAGLIEDFARRVAHTVASARQYTRQATISQVLQRGLLPVGFPARIPGLDTAVVYEPTAGAWAGGDFYDLFSAGEGRWSFALGDVCGNGPEAAVVTGLARPVLRLLAREGYGVAEVLGRLNHTLTEEAVGAVEAAAAAAAAMAVGGRRAPAPALASGEASRFLSLLYGELVPAESGVRCTLASAGHPLPLLLSPSGEVRPAAQPQILLGVLEDAAYVSESFDLAVGDTLLCVTDGVTERRSGQRLFDDGEGLAAVLRGCAGLTAVGVAERVRAAVHGFAAAPPDDDLAILVLQAR